MTQIRAPEFHLKLQATVRVQIRELFCLEKVLFQCQGLFSSEAGFEKLKKWLEMRWNITLLLSSTAQSDEVQNASGSSPVKYHFHGLYPG